jgi:hypothetical protein
MKRNLFQEILGGFEALAKQRAGEVSLSKALRDTPIIGVATPKVVSSRDLNSFTSRFKPKK